MSALRHPRALLQLEDGLVVCDTWSHRVLKYVPEAMAPELLAGTPNSCAPASQCRRDVHRGGSSEQQLSFPSSVAFLGPALLVPRRHAHAHRHAPRSRTRTTIGSNASRLARDEAPKGLRRI